MIDTLKNILEGLRITNQTVKNLLQRIDELEKRVNKLESVIEKTIKENGEVVEDTNDFNREILAENLMAGLELDSAEIYYISYHNTQSPNGLNLKSGGAGGRHSEETKQLLRKPRSSEGRVNIANANRKKAMCPAYRLANSKAQKGKTHSATHNANVSKAKKGTKTGDDNPMKRWENRVNSRLSKQLCRYEKQLEAAGSL